MYLVQGTAQEDLPEKQTSSAFFFYLYYYFVVQGSVFMFCPLLSTLLNSHNEPQQMCIISCSLWKENMVDIEHWSLKLQICCSIIHDATE